MSNKEINHNLKNQDKLNWKFQNKIKTTIFHNKLACDLEDFSMLQLNKVVKMRQILKKTFPFMKNYVLLNSSSFCNINP